MEVWGWVLSVLVALVTVSQGIDAFKKLIKPATNMHERMVAMETQHEKDSERFDKIEEKLEQQEVTNQAILTALSAIVNNAIDGGNITELIHARDELVQHIIVRGDKKHE